MNDAIDENASKVAAVTLGFWIIKIAATTLGETAGDWVTMSLGLGYLVGTAIFAAVMIVGVTLQIRAKQFYPVIYWTVIIATTTLGTTMADFADRSLGVGYPGGVSILLTLLIASIAIWYWSEGSVSVNTVTTARTEAFYWTTILFSQTLGTALGDWMAGSDRGGLGLGYETGALVFAAAIAIVAGVYFWTNVSRTALFWAAFVLTRPLGATLGDFLDKPLSNGGLALNRLYASLILIAFMVVCTWVFPQRAGRHPGGTATLRAKAKSAS